MTVQTGTTCIDFRNDCMLEYINIYDYQTLTTILSYGKNFAKGLFGGFFASFCSRPLEGREHVTLRAAIPMRFTRAARRSTRVLRKKRAKHLAFQVGLYCNFQHITSSAD